MRILICPMKGIKERNKYTNEQVLNIGETTMDLDRRMDEIDWRTEYLENDSKIISIPIEEQNIEGQLKIATRSKRHQELLKQILSRKIVIKLNLSWDGGKTQIQKRKTSLTENNVKRRKTDQNESKSETTFTEDDFKRKNIDQSENKSEMLNRNLGAVLGLTSNSEDKPIIQDHLKTASLSEINRSVSLANKEFEVIDIDETVSDCKIVFENSKKIFTCVLCSKTFDRITPLMVHSAKIHFPQNSESENSSTKSSNKIHFCSKCPKSFQKIKHLAMHAAASHKQQKEEKDKSIRRVFACVFCPEKFDRISFLMKHSAEVHKNADHASNENDNSLTCISPPQTFTTKNELMKHSAEVHKHDNRVQQPNNINNSLTCISCPQIFRTQSELIEHSARVHQSGHHTFRTPSQLINQNNSTSAHKSADSLSKINNSKMLTCSFCPLILNDENKLTKHSTEVHGNVVHLPRPSDNNNSFMSISCPQIFKTQSELKKHSEKGKADKSTDGTPQSNKYNSNFRCLSCSVKFPSLDELIKHSSEVHKSADSSSNSFTCVFCPQTFTGKNELMKHSSQSHFNKEIEMKQINQKIHFNKGMELKEIIPQIISRKTIQTKKFFCVFCPESFQFKKHLMVHSSRNHFQEETISNHLPRILPSVQSETDDLIQIISDAGRIRYGCVECQISFSNREEILKHISMWHPSTSSVNLLSNEPLSNIPIASLNSNNSKTSLNTNTPATYLNTNISTISFNSKRPITFSQPQSSVTSVNTRSSKTPLNSDNPSKSNLEGKTTTSTSSQSIRSYQFSGKNIICKFCPEKLERLELLMFHVREVHSDSMTNTKNRSFEKASKDVVETLNDFKNRESQMKCSEENSILIESKTKENIEIGQIQRSETLRVKLNETVISNANQTYQTKENIEDGLVQNSLTLKQNEKVISFANQSVKNIEAGTKPKEISETLRLKQNEKVVNRSEGISSANQAEQNIDDGRIQNNETLRLKPNEKVISFVNQTEENIEAGKKAKQVFKSEDISAANQTPKIEIQEKDIKTEKERERNCDFSIEEIEEILNAAAIQTQHT